MIKVENGNVAMNGSMLELFGDFTSIILSMRRCFTERYDQEFADSAICLCGRLAVYSVENGCAPPDDHEITRQFKDLLTR